jgi:hypothetical protein
MQALPLRHYHVPSLNHLVSKDFVHILSPFGNELIKHNMREVGDAIHEISIGMLHKVYRQVFKKLYNHYAKTCKDKSESS